MKATITRMTLVAICIAAFLLSGCRLSAMPKAVKFDVTGTWYSPEWGLIELKQVVNRVKGVYERKNGQLDKAYLSAFVDMAKGRSLEFVVSNLGMRRILAGLAVGTVEFSRRTLALRDITIPVGTVVSDRNGNRYETTEERTLRQGQLAVKIPILAVSEHVLPVAAGEITVMPLAVPGIERVTNHEPTVLGAEDESDEQLRARAKASLSRKAITTAEYEAIRFAILEQGLNSGVTVVIPDMPRGMAGELDGVLKGRRLNYRWWEKVTRGEPYEKAAKGERGYGYFMLSEDGNSMKGEWRYEDSTTWDGVWTATRK